MNIESRIISGKGSTLLDTIRLGASIIVVCLHARDLWFPNLRPVSGQPGDVAHAAVVVFFVLSGYVIAHTTTSNNRGPLHYTVARLSRLYSVIFPALVITAIIELLLMNIAPALASEHSRSHSWPRYFVTGSFLNEIWFFSAAPRIITPLWSLGFEFWYYAIFGFWFYRSTGLRGLLLPTAACLLAGPKILAMMPLWIAGVIAYRLPRPKFSLTVAWSIVVLCLSSMIPLVMYLPPSPFGLGHTPLFFASQFLTDWVVGIPLATALWILPTDTMIKPSTKWTFYFRQIADLTFPLYVLHFPLLVLCQGLWGRKLYDIEQLIQALTIVFIIIAMLGLIMEKQRPIWTRLFILVAAKLLPKNINTHVFTPHHSKS